MYCAIIALLASIYPVRNATDRFNILESSASNSLSISASSNSAASGQTIDLTAAMPVVAAGSTTQTLTQIIDPTKVKLTSASDITYPAGWTLSYSTDGTTFSSTAPTTTAGWAAVRAVRATGDLVSSGSSNGFQVASRTATGTAVSLTPPATSASVAGSDGYQAFFDAGRTRVFNIFHHSGALTASLDCHMISTGATCVGFPFAFGGETDEAANGVVVGSTIWAASVSGFYCIDIAAVLANTSNSSGGGSPSKCFSSGSTALVTGTSGKRLTWFTGASTLGQSAETKLYALNPRSTPNAEIYCIDTLTRALCSGSPKSTLIPGGASIVSFDISNVLKVGDLLYTMVSTQDGSVVSNWNNTISCINVTTWTRCAGWTQNYTSYSGVYVVERSGKFADVPNAQGGSRGVCYIANTANVAPFLFDPDITVCWDANGQTFTASSVDIPSMKLPTFHAYGNPVRLGTRLYIGNSGWSGRLGEIICYDATANSNAGGRCNGETNNLTSIGTGLTLENYTVTPDPSIPNCLWVTRHGSPIILTFDILNKTAGCSSISPTTASFSGSAIVPRMACNSNQDAIRQWESFTLKTAGTGTFTSATLTVKNSSGVAISGWTDRAVSLNTPLDLSTLSPGSTGLTPSFEVAFGGISGSITTASAEVKVVGDSPELCTRVTAAYVCPTGSGPIAALTNNTATVSANGSSVLGGATTTLPQVDQSITVIAPDLSTCTSSITGRAGDGGGGASGTAISGVTVSLLDSSGNPVQVNGSPVTTTTASDGTYSFAGLLPNSYKVKFGNSQIAEVQSTTITSGGSGTTSRLPATSCTAGTSTLVENPAGDGLLNQVTGASVLNRSTPGNLVVNGDFTSTPVTSGGSTVAIQSGEVGMRAAGRDDHRLPGWSFSGGGPSTYARWQNSGASTPDGASAGNFYFGNSWWLTTPTFNATTAFSSGGVTQNSYVFRQDSAGNYGMTDANPVQISQTISTDIGRTYRLQFWQSSEPYGNNAGIAALELTGYSRTYFKVNRVTTDWTRYTFDFVATSNSTTLTFKSWGHISPSSDELRLDDVIVSRCGNADAEVNSGTTTISAGTGAVVNALFVVPAAATADIPAAGAQGVAQTINVLSNDNAASGSTLTASTVRFCGVSPTQTPPSCSQTTLTTADGSYSVNTSTGVVTFTPIASFTGTATQPPTYQVTDSANNVVSATITPSVIARPTLIADTSSGAWNQNQTISPLANDVAGSGATLVATSVKLCGSSDIAPNCSANSLTIAGQGTYTVVADGTITFDPDSSFTGTATPVTYSVTDSVGQKTATTITPTVLVPVAPVANPQSKLVLPTGTAAFTTITGANGLATGTQLSPSQTFLCDVAPNAQTPPNCNTTTVTTADGTWVLNQTTGVVTYQPNAGTSTGTKTAVMYQVTDPVGQSASAALTPVIPPAPTANPDTSTGRQAVAQLISLLGNDQPGLPSSPIDVGSVKFCVGNQVAPNCGATSLTVSGEGTYEINSLGIVTFRPLASFLGTATTITYQISDSLGQSATSTLTVTVIPPPVAVATDEVESDTNNTVASPVPIAIRDLGFGAYGKSIVFEPWANDSGGNKPAGTTQQDPQVVPTSIRLCAVGQSAPNCAATTITTPDGSYTLETSTGKVTFTPVAGFTGTATAPITYQISNNWSGPSGAATTTAILIPIIGAPGDPLAKNDDTTTKPETPVTLKPIANDTAGSSALNPTTLRLCQETDIAPNCTHLSVTNRHGTYVVNPTTGAVTFTPAKGFTGLATIPYVVSAMNAQTAYAHLTITVGEQAANQSPAGDLPQTGSNTTKLFALMALLIAIGFIALIKAKKYDLTTKQIADAAQHARS